MSARRLALACALALALPGARADGARPFVIRVVDERTGRGVPQVELATTSALVFVTDSAGVVAIDDPLLLGRDVWFTVSSHGYEYPADGFGFRGKSLAVVAGGAAELRLTRRNLAERLYRITGHGIYRESLKAGLPVPIREPLLASGVAGQDSALCVPWRGKLWWFWGDTNRLAYPLGNFGVTGATSDLTADPDRGLDLDYFADGKGFVRPCCPIEGPGPKWLDGLMVVEDALVAHFVRVKTLGVNHEQGLVRWDDATSTFAKLASWPVDDARHPSGHPVLHEGWYYFGAPFPTLRVRASLAAVADRAAYEPVASDVALRDVETGAAIEPHGGTVSWSEYRRRWIAIVQQVRGSSLLGEVWYAESDALVGPWRWAKKVVTHDRYSFYNVLHHRHFDRGSSVYFEGTYSSFFVEHARVTPLYDYNQILYRLDLNLARVPVPVYRVGDAYAPRAVGAPVAFWAYDRADEGLVAGAGGAYWGLPPGDIGAGQARHGDVRVFEGK